ncbi:malignant fibrous histiocytoma-amplified sequence 1-like [Hoplias malabaricus]|uniref:malignant fibrous histiocytoma-amplified sequence 1-like n=1 Tax=Hoplias malabaricus TaxID=27720 RepID=UPI003462AF55
MLTTNGCHFGKKEEDFAGKKLRSLPPALLAKSQDPVKVDLQRNRLKQVTGISRLSNLTELNLSRNEITEFPLEIKQLRCLLKLYLNQNSIKNIPDGIFPSLEKLQFLKMSTNRLVKLPSDMNRCQSLVYLNLSNNSLKDLQPLVGLLRLKDIYVENNQLAELPRALFQSQNFNVFKVNGNPLRMPPEEICAGGSKDIKSYFDMLEDNSCSVCTIKTMFLGSSMAGKSTLCRSLTCGRPVAVAEADRTVGIDIREVDRDGVRFLFWDFAGQEEYYITHHIFITPQAFVILAIDLSSYHTEDPQSFREKVGFWISNILLKVPNSVVLLVGTHTDQCTDVMEAIGKKYDIEKRVEQMLSETKESLEQQRKNLEELEDLSLFSEQMSEIERLTEYKLKVLDLVPIDCTDSKDIASLQAHIKDLTSKKDTFPFMEQRLPQCYQKVETALQGLLNQGDIPPHGIITQEDLLYYLRDMHRELDQDKMKLILQYLHRIGVIMWYMEIQHLKDMVFVKPSFLISLFKAVVRHDLVSVLEAIPNKDLKSENSLQMHRKRWVSNFQERATLSNVAIRILVRNELERSVIQEKDLVEDIVGTKKKAGSLLTLLQHFDVCLPTKQSSPLNPAAQEFCPNRKWEPSDPSVYDPDGACLFPSFLTNNEQVKGMWGMDNLEDINVQVYFLPEIPHHFFHRLVIKICSFYSTYWIGKDQCLFSCGNRRVLLREHVTDGDQFIEIRCKDSDVHSSLDIQKAWDMIKVIMKRLAELTHQWRGLCQFVHTPCKQSGCSDYFEWRDWQDWLDSSGSEKFNMVSEEKLTCRNGHTRRTELLFPVSISEVQKY